MIAEISDALVEVLEGIDGLRATAHPVDVPHPPMAIVSLTSIDYHGGMGNSFPMLSYRISVVCGRTNERGGWEALERYVDPSGTDSIRLALLEDLTLGGTASTLAVGSAIDVGTVAQQDSSFIVASLEVEIYG